MKTGLLAISGKPIHSGHWALIQKASSENDRVVLYVSISDRKRTGEFPIFGADMFHIWTTHLQPILPQNVFIEFGGSPIRKIYQYIDQHQHNDDEIFVVYSDEQDLQTNFPLKAMEKYFENIWQRNRIKLKPITRLETVDVSGTRMREYLANDDKVTFCKFIPHGCDAEAIWNILIKRKPLEDESLDESLLRTYIKEVQKLSPRKKQGR